MALTVPAIWTKAVKTGFSLWRLAPKVSQWILSYVSIIKLFTESAPKLIQSNSDVHIMYVTFVDNRNQESWRLLVKEYIANIGIPLDFSAFFPFQWFVAFWFSFWFLGVCIKGLAGEGSVAVADGRWQVICDSWHATCDRWQVTCDRWQVTDYTWQLTRDRWQVTHDKWRMVWGEHSLKMFSSLALMVWDLWCFEDLEEKDDLIN